MKQDPSNDGLIDWNEFSTQFGGDEELITMVAEMFIESAERLTETLQAALAGGDSTELERAAHSVKGCVGQVYATATQALALSVETRAAAGQTSELAADVQRLVQEVFDVKAAIASGMRCV